MSSAKWLQPARSGDSKGMVVAWPVAHGQREDAYRHLWAPKAWPGCPQFARRAVEGYAFTLLLPGRRSDGKVALQLNAREWSSLVPSSRHEELKCSASRPYEAWSAIVLKYEKTPIKGASSGLGKVISPLPSRGGIHL